MAVKLELLKTACYFSKLDDKALEDISRFIFEKRLAPADAVLWEGEDEKFIYFVISGLLKLFATSAEGREFIVRLVYGGDSVNDDAILGEGTSMLGAVAMSPVLLFGLRGDDLEKILHSYPPVNSSIIDVFAARQRYLVKLATELVFKDVTGRLARLLLESEKLVRNADNAKITQQEMASMIGTVRELVSRSLKELETMGAISISHNQIVIKDRKRLAELGSL